MSTDQANRARPAPGQSSFAERNQLQRCEIGFRALALLGLLWLTPAVVLAQAAEEAKEPAAPAPPAGQGAAPADPPLEPKVAENAERRVGQLIKIPSPITDAAKNLAIRQAKDFIDRCKRRQEWPVIIFEIEPGSSSFGISLDLARAITELSGATTVAYVPAAAGADVAEGAPVLSGHAVLIAMACEMVVLPTNAKIGDAGADEKTIPAYMQAGYAEIAKSRRTVATDLILGMLDPSLEIYEAKTADQVGREFVRGDRLEELRQEKQVERNPTLLIPAGEAGLFSAQEGKRLGIVDYYADDFATLAKVLNVPPDTVFKNPSLGTGWNAVQVEINEPLNKTYRAQSNN